jgi:hypothetical protein
VTHQTPSLTPLIPANAGNSPGETLCRGIDAAPDTTRDNDSFHNPVMRIAPPASLPLKHVVQSFLDLYFCLRADGTIVDYAAARDTDLYATPETFIGKRMQDVLPAPIGHQFDDAIAHVLRDNSSCQLSTRLSWQGARASSKPLFSRRHRKTAMGN